MVVVVATATAKGWPACMQGEVGGCLHATGSAMGLCRGEVSCTVKDEGEKKGE